MSKGDAVFFEYDPNKSALNADKHGIDFEEAQSLWCDPDMIATSLVRNGEERWVAIARYAGSCWVAVYTLRSETVRIISVRRATKKEASTYDKANR